ncbi:uncharacterized protein LOC124919883 isoform X2 [Impatiens glandulifera]|nr:uncharacterized protein LOC124919883 isoform X2 [Impatiens glandulifera]
MGFLIRSPVAKKPNNNDGSRIVLTTFLGIAFGFLLGMSFPTFMLTKSSISTQRLLKPWSSVNGSNRSSSVNGSSRSNLAEAPNLSDNGKIWVSENPKGAERLPPGIVVAETDYYLRRLWGKPSEDLPFKQKYLVTFTVGYAQRKNIDAAVKKFSGNFTILLFHYDGRTSEWNEFEWSKRAIHISAPKQTKWWYAKRFLHPDIVAAYDYIFIWDEDLGLQHFNAEEYIKLMQKHGLEISQPGLESNKGLTWKMTKRRLNNEIHKVTEERPGWCPDPHAPPCAAFVEIMAPVFSREAWRCVWHLIQNDLVHGWGLDFALRKCVEPAHEKIGVIDSQWIIHQSVPSLGNQGQAEKGKAAWKGVRTRCEKEWGMFQKRVADAENNYYHSIGLHPPNSTSDRQVVEKLTSYQN